MDFETLRNERTVIRQWVTRKFNQAQSNCLEKTENMKELVAQKVLRLFQVDDELDGHGYVQEEIERYGTSCAHLTKYFSGVNHVVAANDFNCNRSQTITKIR